MIVHTSASMKIAKNDHAPSRRAAGETISRRLLLAALACGFVVCGGCGKSDGLVPVAGVVELDGTPLPRAGVIFPGAGFSGNPASGVTDASGRFEIYQPNGLKKGVPPGEYKVIVSQTEQGSQRELIPAKYSNRDKTELSATIGPKGERKLRFSLTSGE